MMVGPVIRLSELALTETQQHGTRIQAAMGRVTQGTGARHLGARLTVVPPGKAAWPFHNHHANDEMFVILSGEGRLRYGAETHMFEAGDVLVCPAGGRETAHQLINTGTEDLRYLAISSMREPEIGEYPDSNKISLLAGSPPGGDKAARTISSFHDAGQPKGYFDGEP